MDHADHVRLIGPGIVRGSGGVWADLGAGTGAFTLAVRDLAGPEVVIHAIDRDRSALRTLQQQMDRAFPGTDLHLRVADFSKPLGLNGLDGIIMANALHFVPHGEQGRSLRALIGGLRPGGTLILVEYDTDRGNRWVPYPLSSRTFLATVVEAGFQSPEVIGRYPSRFLDGMFAGRAFAPVSAADSA